MAVFELSTMLSSSRDSRVNNIMAHLLIRRVARVYSLAEPIRLAEPMGIGF